MKTSERQTVRRLPPCPLYDVERYESWLGDMAAAGLFLQAQGVLARFRRGTPAPARYRLTAARLKGSAFDFLPTAPLQEERTLYAESGWQFVCARGEFFIYGCLDPAAPELHTDPAVQALSLKMARRTAWSSFAGVLLNVVVQAVLWSRRTPLLLLVEQPLPVVCLLLFCCCMLGLALRDLYAVLRLTRRLRRGLPPDHRRPWRAAAWRHYLGLGVSWACFLAVLTSLLAAWAQPDPRRPLAESDGPFPFARLTDLAEGTLLDSETAAEQNTIERRASPLAPVIWECHEDGMLLRDGEPALNTVLSTVYYETAAPWIARRLAPELHRRVEVLASEAQPLPPLPGIDAAYAYRDGDSAFCVLVLVQGRRVACSWWTDPDGTLGFDQLAPKMAAVFAQG